MSGVSAAQPGTSVAEMIIFRKQSRRWRESKNDGWSDGGDGNHAELFDTPGKT